MKAFDRLRTLARLHDLRDRPDAELVRLFADRHDEAAFELLVRRHGPLVLGVCRRALGDATAADDAFQATFLLLARRAPTLRQPAGVANWLYGVAARTTREARRHDRRRRRRERVAARPEAVHPADDTASAVDAAVRRLPEPYRSAVLLCDLGGCTRDEAARELGVPPGTVASRVSRGRALLGAALQKQGLAPAAVLSAVVPAEIAASTARIAGLVAAGEAAPAAVAPLLTYGSRTMLALKLMAATLAISGAAVVLPGGPPPADPPPVAAKKGPTPAERLAALKAEHEADYKATITKEKDPATGREVDVGDEQPITKYLARIKELGDGPDEPTAAAALCCASHTWGYPRPDESEELFRQFLRRFGGTPLAGEFAKGLFAVEGYGANSSRLRQLLQVATDRPSRATLELKLAHMTNPRRGGQCEGESATNLALRRDVALLLYDRLATEYADLGGGKLAATAKAEAAKLRAGQDLPELPAKP